MLLVYASAGAADVTAVSAAVPTTGIRQVDQRRENALWLKRKSCEACITTMAGWPSV